MTELRTSAVTHRSAPSTQGRQYKYNGTTSKYCSCNGLGYEKSLTQEHTLCKTDIRFTYFGKR